MRSEARCPLPARLLAAAARTAWKQQQQQQQQVVLSTALPHAAPAPQVASFTATKLLWLSRHEPETYAKVAHVLLPGSYVNYWLTGRMAMEVSGWARGGCVCVCATGVQGCRGAVAGQLPGFEVGFKWRRHK